jgi:hypothetical protein
MSPKESSPYKMNLHLRPSSTTLSLCTTQGRNRMYPLGWIMCLLGTSETDGVLYKWTKRNPREKYSSTICEQTCCVSNVINFHGIFSASCRKDRVVFKIITAVIGSKGASRYWPPRDLPERSSVFAKYITRSGKPCATLNWSKRTYEFMLIFCDTNMFRI